MPHSMQPEHLKRVVVVGTSGSGKSTLARALADLLNFPLLELDEVFWGPNWTKNPPEYVHARLEDFVQNDSWVLDGNYSPDYDLAWDRANAAIWLDYSFPIVFGRACSRTLRRLATREELFGANRESIGQIFDSDWIPWWVLRTYRSRRREYRERFASRRFAHIQVLTLQTPQDAEALLARLRAA